MNFFTKPRAVIVGLAITGAGIIWHQASKATRFDKSRWDRNPYDGESVRTGMVGDLISTHHLKERHRSEVRSLLGPPTQYSDTQPNEDWYLLEMVWNGMEPKVIVHLVLRYEPETGFLKECGINHY